MWPWWVMKTIASLISHQIYFMGLKTSRVISANWSARTRNKWIGQWRVLTTEWNPWTWWAMVVAATQLQRKALVGVTWTLWSTHLWFLTMKVADREILEMLLLSKSVTTLECRCNNSTEYEVKKIGICEKP